jgi:hypothetical protein
MRTSVGQFAVAFLTARRHQVLAACMLPERGAMREWSVKLARLHKLVHRRFRPADLRVEAPGGRCPAWRAVG